MSNAPAIQVALAHHEYLRDQLRLAFPTADEDTLADTLEGESNLDALLIAVMRSADEDGLLVAGIKARVEELTERRKRIERRIEAKEAVVLSTMERASLKRIEAPDFTVSVQATPAAVIVTDEKAIPADYWKPQDPKLDKAGISAALKAKKDVPGAMLSNGGATLSVRRK